MFLARVEGSIVATKKDLYNRYAHDVARLGSRFESFMEEFSNVLQRQP